MPLPREHHLQESPSDPLKHLEHAPLPSPRVHASRSDLSRQVTAEHSSARQPLYRTAPLRHSPRASSASLEPRAEASSLLINPAGSFPCLSPLHLSPSTESQSETPHHS